MHQASILMTAFVMIMGGAWYAMKELNTDKPAPPAIEQSVQLASADQAA